MIPDGSGDREVTWTTIFPIYGHIEDISVRDLIAARKDQSGIAVRVLLRQSDIEPLTNWKECRLLCDGVFYKVIQPLRDNRTGNEWITLACEAGVYTWQDAQ